MSTDSQEPCTIEWLRARDWKIFSKPDGTYGAQFRGGSVGPFNQFCQIDELGCSFTAMQSKDAVKWSLAGFPVDSMPQTFAYPLIKGWPTRQQVINIEQLFNSLPR